MQFVDAEALGRRDERSGLTDHGFPCAEHQIAIGGKCAGKALECSRTGVVIEIEQHIAAQDEVEPPTRRRFGEHIVLLEPSDVAHVIEDLPTFGRFFEMP